MPSGSATPIVGPLFVGQREIDFFNCVNKELIQKIVAQRVTYYSVSEEHTKANDLYNEAITKTVYTPVVINALVLFMDPTQTTTNFSIDTIYQIEVYFHEHELTERNIIPQVGDFMKFGEVYYEILTLTSPQIIFGQIDNKVMKKATARVARTSNFEIVGE